MMATTRALVLRCLCMTLVLIALLSCGGRPKKQDGVVEVWHGFNAEEATVFRELVKEFEEDYARRTGKPIRVNLQYVSFNDMFTKLRTAAQAHITPDIAFVDSIKVTDLAFGQALVRLDELEGFKSRYESLADARREFVGAPFDAGTVNRLGVTGLYGLPVQATTVALFWNREMFRNNASALVAAGLDPNRAPRDWDEMLAYGRVLTNRQRNVFGYATYNSLWFNFPFFNQYNVAFISYDEDGLAQPDLNNPRGHAALARIQSIVTSGVEGGAWLKGALGPDAGFLNRRYAMCLTGPWNVESFTNAGLDFDIALVPAPPRREIEALGLEPADPDLVAEFGDLAYTSSNIGGQSGVIMRSAPDKELAYEVLEYFTSEPVQRRWGSRLGQIPIRLAAWKDLDTSRYPYLPVFMTQLRTARRIPQLPRYEILENEIFNPQLDLLLQGQKAPEAMMESMEKDLRVRLLEPINEAARRRKDNV